MSKILVLTSRLPYPVIGGDKLRIYNICRFLYKNGCELTLLSFVRDKSEEKIAIESSERKIFKDVQTVVLPKWQSYLNSAMGLLTEDPLQTSYYRSEEMKEIVQENLKNVNYNAVIVHLIRMAPYIMNIMKPGMRNILEMTDAISLNYARSKKYKRNGMLGEIYRIEEKRVRKYEQKCLEKFDSIVVVSSVDKDYFLKDDQFLNSKLKVISNGVHENLFHICNSDYDPNLIIFMGNMRTYQNVDAVLYFIRKIYPLLRAKMPDIKFRIIGNAPPHDIISLHGKNNIQVTGKVNDILNYAKGACLSVCPMRIGAGVQNKILESMAMGIPVVTTSLGFEGLEAIPGKDLLVADNHSSFAEVTFKLMSKNVFRDYIASNGKLLIKRKYSWDNQLKGYKKLIGTY